MNQISALSGLFRHLTAVVVAAQLVAFFSSAPMTMAQTATVHQVRVESVNRFSAEEFLVLTNEARRAKGLAPLVLNAELTSAAKAKASDMSEKGYWEHFRPGDNKAPWDFITESGYSYKVAGENLARGFSTPSGITKAWLASPSHYANLMSTKYVEVGFACIESIDANGSKVLLTVQMFGAH
jgi:uncharacterized protein YkwD